jgi:DNA polymerase III alpha subunit (gram-positive type)
LAAKAHWIRPAAGCNGNNSLWSSASFSEYISLCPAGPRRKVPYHIAKLTGITSKMLRSKGIPFGIVWEKFTAWLMSCSEKKIVMMAHNGKAFDFPFLQVRNLSPFL